MDAPFVVAATVAGQRRSSWVADPAAALRQIVSWCDGDDAASGCWYLDERRQEPVTLTARLRSGLAPASQCQVHLFVFVPGVRQDESLAAVCDAQLHVLDVEWVPLGRGIPCNECLTAAARSGDDPHAGPHGEPDPPRWT